MENIHRDKLDSAVDLYFGNILAVIKLHKNKILAKISNGVFRCILEYQFPKVLFWRYSDPFGRTWEEQDKHFPTIDKLDYDNYLVAVNEILNCEY